MEDKQTAWKNYKQTVFERIGDFSDLFAGVRKQKAGSDDWVSGCCPFHDDQNPSFAYNKKTGKWACFSGCGKGSAIDYLMQTTGSSFKDALLSLGDKAGIPHPGSNGYRTGVIQEALIESMIKALWKNEKLLKYLREKRGLSDETIRKYRLGWDDKRKRIAIPIADPKGKVVNVRFYSPNQKPKMINFKGFGNTPRLYGADELAQHEGKQAVLCEGEFDRLLLQQNGFMAVTSTHGCASFREDWLPLFKDKEVVVLYDCDPEGQGSAQGVVFRAFQKSQVASLKNIKLPLPGTKDDKDITDFFVKSRPVNGSLFEKFRYTSEDVRRLIDQSPPIDLKQPLSATITDGSDSALLNIINQFRKSESLKNHERNVAIAEAVTNHLAHRGAFFYDPKASTEYLCLDGQVLLVGNNRIFNGLLQEIGRLNVTNSEGRFVWEFIRNHARKHGSPVQSGSWVYGNPSIPAIYVHAHDDSGQIFKIKPNSIELIPNGQNDDKILLNPSDRVQPFTYLKGQDMEHGLRLLKEFLYDKLPCSEPARAFLTAFLPIVFLRDFCPTKPLVRISGIHGSGKTLLTTAISHILYGENVGKSATSSANYTDASKNPLTILDNKEAKDIDRDLLNFLLTASTGIVHEKRKLYENQEIIRERANAFIITNGIETLGKPELLSRQWEIQCDSTFFQKDYSETEHLKILQEHRNKILSALFDLIAREILPKLSMRPQFEQALTARFKNHHKSRTFGCLSLILIAWDALERILGLPKGLDAEWIADQQEEAKDTSQETNLFVQFLGLLETSHQGYEQMGVKLNFDGERKYFEASCLILYNLFAKLAKDHGLAKPFESPKQLGERLKESLPVLQNAGWEVQMQAKKVRGLRLHRFCLPCL